MSTRPGRRVTRLTGLAILAVLTLNGCTDDAGEPQTPSTQNAGPTPTPTDKVTPDPEERGELTKALAGIDAELGTPAAVESSIKLCDLYRQGKSGADVVEAARTAYTIDLSRADAGRVVLAVKEAFCNTTTEP